MKMLLTERTEPTGRDCLPRVFFIFQGKVSDGRTNTDGIEYYFNSDQIIIVCFTLFSSKAECNISLKGTWQNYTFNLFPI